ncbi:hypothetical protein Bca101_039079 [Brassica carinata]
MLGAAKDDKVLRVFLKSHSIHSYSSISSPLYSSPIQTRCHNIGLRKTAMASLLMITPFAGSLTQCKKTKNLSFREPLR